MNGVKKYFTAFHHISYKKKSSLKSPHFLQNFSAFVFNVYKIWYTFRRNLKEKSDRWRNERSVEMQEVRSSNASTEVPFCKKFVECGWKNNALRFTAFTAKRCKKYAVKTFCFHRSSPNFLQKFTAKPQPGLQPHIRNNLSKFNRIWSQVVA